MNRDNNYLQTFAGLQLRAVRVCKRSLDQILLDQKQSQKIKYEIRPKSEIKVRVTLNKRKALQTTN